ncbi:uncharacterized protein LOC129270304 [Lytechinus pictus]|uniref:uncharacterized protein LOC129270304 n=1 Tax=Lytechinus pictus TaxID=7653 RepID=UPI0030BA2A1E
MSIRRIIYILTILTMFNMCESIDEFLTAMEGDTVDLYYRYPCNSTRTTLQYGRRMPFYILEDAESITLPPEQAKRFTFTNEKTEDDHCLLFIRIKDVSRTDAGTYIFFAYIKDDVHDNSLKMIGLDVDFLPGKASCEMSYEGMEGDWVTLNCIAPVGSVSGQIVCYQNGEKMPSRTDPYETNKYLKQTKLAKKTLPVFCCSSTWEHTKDRCECNDFQWVLSNNKNMTSIIDPCGPPTTISVPNAKLTTETVLPPSKSKEFVSREGMTSQSPHETMTDSKQSWNFNQVASIVCLVCIAVAEVFLFLHVIAIKQKFRKSLYEFTSSEDKNQYAFYEPLPKNSKAKEKKIDFKSCNENTDLQEPQKYEEFENIV